MKGKMTDMVDFLGFLINGKEYFEKLKGKENIVCWGAGSKGRQTLSLLREKGIKPVAFCDNNPGLAGKYIEDIPVMDYDAVKERYKRYCICITCTFSNALEIYNMLQNKGEQNDIYFVSNPFKAENKFLDINEIMKDKKEYEESYNAFIDEESKKLFVEFLNWKITGDLTIMNKKTESSWLEYFDEEIIPQQEDYCYIDAGAYTGDSICRFLALTRGKYDLIMAFEPDDNNFEALQSLIANGRLERIETIKEGLWSEEGEKVFYMREGNGTYESANFFRNVACTLCNRLLEDGGGYSKTVIVKTLDSYLDKLRDKNRILLKIDTLASEGAIIRGGKKLIKLKKPVIIMEYGTHSEYIASLIPYLMELRPDYKFYLRQCSAFDNSRTILYAI